MDILEIMEIRGIVGESRVSCINFYSNLCDVKSVEYLKLLFISLGSLLVTFERDIFKLTALYFVHFILLCDIICQLHFRKYFKKSQ